MTSRLVRITLAIFLSFPLICLADIPQYRGRQVGHIEIIVHKASTGSAFDPDAVRARLKTKVGDTFSQLDFDEDLKHLSDDFDRIEPKIEVADDRINITLDLWPKPTIRSIKWVGNDKFKSGKLQKELGIKSGTIYERHSFNLAFNKVRAFLIKKGYFEAELNYKVIPDPALNEVDIVVDIQEGRTGRVKGIEFEGFSKSESQAILDMIATKKHGLLSWITGKGTYSEEAAEQDRYIVLSHLHNLGYADARVQMTVADSEDGKGLIVTFIADKGPMYYFGDTGFTGSEFFTQEEMESRLTYKTGEPFSPDKVRSTQKAISDLFGSKGYIDAAVNFEPHLNADDHIYNIDYDIDQGQQYRVGMVRIFGNDRTQQRVVLHESILQPGEVFDIRRLQHTEERLRNIGYFDNVNVYPVIPACCPCPIDEDFTLYDPTLPEPLYRDVYIELCEASTGSFGVFFGYSTQDSGFTGIELMERNFNYEGIPRIFRDGPAVLRGGGEYARLRANLGKRQATLLASWTKPYFMDTCWVVGFDVDRSWNRRQSTDYDLENVGVTAHATYPFRRCWRLSYHYRLKYLYVDLHNRDNAGERLLREARNNGTLSAVGMSLTYDTVNYCHTQGLASIAESEYAGLLGKFDFIKLSWLNTAYQPLWNIATLKLRADLRYLIPIWDQTTIKLPINEKFFLGGESTVRGYSPYSIGPQSNGEPIGGLSSALLSAEINRCFLGMVDGFAFFDAGYVSEGIFAWKPLRMSVGVGARIKLMGQMPITVGYGYPINPERSSDRQGIFFSVGGQF